MAYPGEKEHVAYLRYVEKVAMGEIQGPQLSKAEWRKKYKKQNTDASKATMENQKKWY